MIWSDAGSFLLDAERARSGVEIMAGLQPRMQAAGHAPGEGLRPQSKAYFLGLGAQFDPSRFATYPFGKYAPDKRVQNRRAGLGGRWQQ